MSEFLQSKCVKSSKRVNFSKKASAVFLVGAVGAFVEEKLCNLLSKHLQCTPKRATRYNCCLEMRFSFLLFWHAWAKKSNTTGETTKGGFDYHTMQFLLKIGVTNHRHSFRFIV